MRSNPPHVETPDGPLVNGDWLEGHLDTADVRVLDVRGRHPSSLLPHAKRLEYEAGHIPGAVFVDWEHDFIDPDDPVPVQVASAESFAARAGELGIGEGALVVTYDDYYGIFASRVAWAFRYYGAEARVLDGGWTTWQDEMRPVSERSTPPEPRRFTASPDMESVLSRGASQFFSLSRVGSWGRVGGWVGGGPAAVRDACQTDIRGFGDAAGRWFVVGSRCLVSSVASRCWGRVAHS
jgi:3-mercaptopyruvate sulfurtransferase SseA